MRRVRHSASNSSLRRLLPWLGGGVRCRRCGLKARLARWSVHARFKVDADAWSRRCRALREANPPATPFDCPFLAEATSRRNQSSDSAV
jgi:hypothetical protein